VARPKRKKLQFGDEESLNNLLQEVYNESHNIRANVVSLFTVWNKNVKDNGEIAAVGDKLAKLLTILSKNQDQKIMILKHLKDSIYVDNKNKGDASEIKAGQISANEKDELDSFVDKIRKQQKEGSKS
jgi:hypothetical protein